MLDHVSLGVTDIARATAFYAEVLAPLGYRIHRTLPNEVALGPGEDWSFFLYPGDAAKGLAGDRMHLAFRATSDAIVRDAYARALANGARAIPDRAPDRRPQFGEDYYGAVFADPDGHVIEVLSRDAHLAPPA